MKLLIIRHADPDYSIDSLTPQGHKEAELLSRRLCRMDIKDFYVSVLGRARHTAEYTLSKMGRTARQCDWLKEFPPVICRPDCPEGVVWDWLPQDWTTQEEFFSKEKWLSHPALHEGVRREYEYVTSSLDALLADHGYVREGRLYRAAAPNEDTLAFFCHFGLTCVLLSHLINISPMQLWHGCCAAPSSVTTLVTEERREGYAYFRMSSFGDTSHLYAGGEEPSFSARFCETFANKAQRHD